MKLAWSPETWSICELKYFYALERNKWRIKFKIPFSKTAKKTTKYLGNKSNANFAKLKIIKHGWEKINTFK